MGAKPAQVSRTFKCSLTAVTVLDWVKSLKYSRYFEVGRDTLDARFRSRQIESACFSGTAAFMEVRIQSVVVEFILNNTEALFSTKLNAVIRESAGESEKHTQQRVLSTKWC